MSREDGHAGYVAPMGERVSDLPERLRPREEMARCGVGHVSDDVLLSVILRSGVRGTSVVSLARRLLSEYGSFTGLSAASVEELAQVKGMGPVKAQVVAAALEMARRMSQEATPRQHQVRSPEDAVRVLREEARGLDREVFWVLPLDARNRLKGGPVDVTSGLLDASLVHPREVFRHAIRVAAAGVVIAHNHPSGDPSASSEDLRITRQLIDAGRIIDIKVLDHVIVGKRDSESASDYCSLRESGLVDFK